MRRAAGAVMGAVLAGILSADPLAVAAVDRAKLLTQSGVYATFAVFRVESDWWKLDKAVRASAVTEMNAAFQRHGDKVVADVYLLRGLVERADFFVRVHAPDVLSIQNFLVDLMGTALGRYLLNTQTFNGLTKPAHYVPGFPEELKTALKTPVEPGERPYAIVVPVQKDAEWWNQSQEARTEMMKEHTEAAVPYLKTVHRKLYHASGLDDLDFITYFETAKLDDFNNLIIALERVRENRHNRRFGQPTLLGTRRSLEDVLDILSR